jgi:hypothetical protein
MNQKKLIESAALSLCIAALYYLGEFFKFIAPVRHYHSPVGVNQILIWSSLRFALFVVFVFCIIYFGLQAKKDLARRICSSAVASFVIVCLIFGLFNIADIRPGTLFGGAKEAKVYLVAFIVLFGVFAVFRQTERAHSRIIESSKAFSFVLAGLFLFRVYSNGIPLVAEFPEQTARNLSFHDSVGKKQGRRVIFVVFDEFDPTVAFSKKADGIELKNFKSLIEGAFFAPNAMPPAKFTIESIPAMMLGRETKGNSYDQQRHLYLKTGSKEKIEFNQKNSHFDNLPDGSSSLSILGFYHPYCQIYKTADCVSFPLTKLAEPNSWKFWDSTPVSEYITSKQLELLPSFLELKSRQLVYIHLNVPHLDASFAAKTFQRPKPADMNEQYVMNLALSDQILGSIVNSINQHTTKEEVLLIVCSDHWFRRSSLKRDEAQGLPALMIVKVLSDDRGIRFDEISSTHHLTALAIDFLRAKVNNNSDVSRWFQGKPVYKTYVRDKSSDDS